MKPEATAILLGIALLSTPCLAAAQTIEDQVEDAQAKASELADETGDPRAFADNATSPGWQGDQVNWTKTWTCDTGYTVDERAGEAMDEAADCPQRPSVRAEEGEDDNVDAEDQRREANESQADAEEAEGDAERAARDEAAAAGAFANDTREDPRNASRHAQTFLDRTFAILNRTLGIFGTIASLPVEGAQLAGNGLAAAGSASLGGVQAAGHAGAEAARATGSGLLAGVSTLGDGISASIDAAGAATGDGLAAAEGAVQASVDALGEGLAALERLTSSDDPLERPDPSSTPEDLADPATQGVRERLPVEAP